MDTSQAGCGFSNDHRVYYILPGLLVCYVVQVCQESTHLHELSGIQILLVRTGRIVEPELRTGRSLSDGTNFPDNGVAHHPRHFIPTAGVNRRSKEKLCLHRILFLFIRVVHGHHDRLLRHLSLICLHDQSICIRPIISLYCMYDQCMIRPSSNQ